MTAAEIVDRLCNRDQGVTPERVRKAKGLAHRQEIAWQAVLEAMTPAQRAAVTQAEKPIEQAQPVGA